MRLRPPSGPKRRAAEQAAGPAADQAAEMNGGALTPPVPPVRFEARMLLIIAGPLIAAYLAEFAMGLTTKVIVGRLGYEALGGIGLATDLALELIVTAAALLSVVGVLVAQADGAGRRQDAGVAARQGLIIATVVGAPMTVLVWYLDIVLAWTGQSPETVAVVTPYVKPLSLSILPLLWFYVLRIFVASLAKTGAVMVITLAAVALNYVLCLGLVTGAFGMPAMGPAGAGWAKTATVVFMLAALLIYTFRTPAFRGCGLFKGRLRYDARVFGEIMRLGAPVAGVALLETSMFAAVSIFSGVIGPVALAVYHVMMAWVVIAFTTAHGLAEAGMVRVAHGMGRGRLEAARRAGLLAFVMGVVWLIVLAAAPLSFTEPLVRVFLSPEDPGYAAVLALTAQLLPLAAFFQVFDGLQVMAVMALRGLRDTVAPMWIGALGYWGFGVAGGWILAFEMDMGAAGLWWGLAVGLTVTGSLLALRFVRLTRPDGRLAKATA
ncbi:MAG: MATE family efflux transporter [Rhodospirillales bacterium]